MERVSVDDVAAYRDHGAVCLRGLFADQWLELMAAGVEKDKADPGPLVRHNTPDGNPGDSVEGEMFPRAWPRSAASS